MLRTSSQRQIYQLLQATLDEISAQEIHQRLRLQGQQKGLATVYRALRGLQQKGLVYARPLVTREQGFGLCERATPHCICVQCGNSVRLADNPLDEFVRLLTQRADFLVYYHTLEFVGLCLSCQDDRAGDGGSGEGPNAERNRQQRHNA
ncbi:MAG: transcriptional repressor [Synechococcales cyanobacterium RU_4_20]|nr:transcriptional repressor [Synechococcales cyanobacterium RU_4_20]